MSPEHDDDLVAFHNVRVVRSTVPALLCTIRDERVWLLRSQVGGQLHSTGDHGRLLVRRSVARALQLIVPTDPTGLSRWARSIWRRRSLGHLRLVPAHQGSHGAQ